MIYSNRKRKIQKKNIDNVFKIMSVHVSLVVTKFTSQIARSSLSPNSGMIFDLLLLCVMGGITKGNLPIKSIKVILLIFLRMSKSIHFF